MTTTTDTGRRGNGRALDMRPSIPAPSRLGQGTAVEQSRAVAEVHAAIVVAQQCPRSVSRAIDDMRESCRRKELADRAFFRYKRGNGNVTGPSIHLARELARVWGNIQYGLTELRRDDDYGQSEMLAYAWDVQTNSRCSSIVINPHKLYTGGRELTELRDIYENNANVGARRVREAIFAVLPAWFVEEAKDICTKTITDGGGVALPQRIANAVEVFGNLGVTVAQLEAKIGQPTAKWTDQDVAHLRVIRQSLLRNEITKDEEFPPVQDRVTAAEITGQTVAQTSGPAPSGQPAAHEAATGPETTTQRPAGRAPRASKALLGKLDGLLRMLPLGEQDDKNTLLEWQCSGPFTATKAQAETVIAFLEGHLAASQGNAEEAAEEIWAQYRAVHDQDAAEAADHGQDDPGGSHG